MYVTTPKSRKCCFCGATPLTREHVIPEWLSKEAKVRDVGFFPGHFSENRGLQARKSIKFEHLTTRQVCKTCNGGWMSQLESWAKSSLSSAVKPGWQAANITDLKVIRAEVVMMIRWLLKTAIMVEYALPKGDLYKVDPAVYPVASGDLAPTDFYVAGFIVKPTVEVHLRRGFPVWNAGKLEPYQVHESSIDFAIQLHHLALRVFRCPGARQGLKLAYFLRDGRRAVPLILTSDVSYPFPHTHLYPELLAFSR